MIYLILPRGNNFGWGVCGKYLVKELSKITDIGYITEDFTLRDIGDEFDFYFLKSKLIGEPEINKITNGIIDYVDYPILQAIVNQTLQPLGVDLHGTFKAGYTFFEENIIQKDYIKKGKEHFDIIITGSRWCEEVLRNHGLKEVTTIIQGIDPQVFNPSYSEKEILKDYFVIFSGGKCELRKGQDLVIKAYKVIQDRHPDVMLVNSWYNIWAESMKTMESSHYISFKIRSNDYVTAINNILNDNGIDLKRVITLLPRHNALMPRCYQNTDIGLFPNRCEGGTNLVLMEYMACGKPVIASYSSGHKDIINADNSIMIKQMKSMNVYRDKSMVAIWDDPDLEEIISHIEWAYNHREQARSIGVRAGDDMKEITWKRSAEEFFNILSSVP